RGKHLHQPVERRERPFQPQERRDLAGLVPQHPAVDLRRLGIAPATLQIEGAGEGILGRGRSRHNQQQAEQRSNGKRERRKETHHPTLLPASVFPLPGSSASRRKYSTTRRRSSGDSAWSSSQVGSRR